MLDAEDTDDADPTEDPSVKLGALLREPIDPKSIRTRHSLLKKMALSPAHYFEAVQRNEDDSLAARLGAAALDKKGVLPFGNAVHELLLGNTGHVAKFTGKTRRGKDWEAFKADAFAKGATVILNEREHGHASAIAAAVRANDLAMRLLFEGTIVEERIDWTWNGRDVRSTPDARGTSHIADLKTAVTAQPHWFARMALRLHYHAQAALYAQAIATVEDLAAPPIEHAYLIAVEKTPPYPVTILRFTDAALEVGAKLCRLWMERLQVCEQRDEWPEYSAGVVDLDIPDASFGLEIDGKRVEF